MFRSNIVVLAMVCCCLIVGCNSDDNVTGPAPASGTIVVNPEPNSINAPWQLSGPDEYSQSGSGDMTLGNMVVGNYTVTWDAVSGYTTPLSQTQSLADGGTTTFSGTYTIIGTGTDGFILIPAGTFTMGSPSSELGRYSNEVQHEVTLTHSFYMQATEVTNGQYVELVQWAYNQGYVTATSSSVGDNLDYSTVELLDLDDSACQIDFDNGVFSTPYPDRPVVEVTLYGSVAYCDWLSLKDGLPRAYDHGTWTCSGGVYGAVGYRLPTEAEWEYACRAGSTTAFANGPITVTDCGLDPNLDAMGWYCYNSNYQTHDVGGKQANGWGLYDMHGNVWEWCWDSWDGLTAYSPDSVTDPVSPDPGSHLVVRGGGWGYRGAPYCRSAHRNYNDPGSSFSNYGFRLVRSAF